MPFTDAPGFRMRYEVYGAGDPLLLVNGLGSDLTEWLYQVPAFSARYRVIAFDNRGAGESEAPPGPYTTAQMADDAAALLDGLGVARAHLLGVSLGGMIAQQFALRHPGKVDRLVLACTAPGGALSVRPTPEALAAFARDPSADLVHRLANTLAFERRCTRSSFVALLRRTLPVRHQLRASLARRIDALGASSYLRDGTLEAQIRRTIPWLYTERYCRERPEEIEDFVRRRLASPVDAVGVAAQLAAAIGHDAGERLSEIAAPTLVITGTADRLVPPENSRRIAERIPGSRLVRMDGAPHRLFAENAVAFNREVLAFLDCPKKA